MLMSNLPRDLPRRAHLSTLWHASAFAIAFMASGCQIPHVPTDMFVGENFKDSEIAIINGCYAGLVSLTVDGMDLKPPENDNTSKELGLPLRSKEGFLCIVRVLPGKHDLMYQVGGAGRATQWGEIDVRAGHNYTIKQDICVWCRHFTCKSYSITGWVEDEAGKVVHGQTMGQKRAQNGC